MEIKRQMNMALSRNDYIAKCKETSEVLVEHVIKLMIYKSPNDVRGCLISVTKGLKCELMEFFGMKNKPIRMHLHCVTELGGPINLVTLTSLVEDVKETEEYSKLPIRPNITPISIKSALNDLIDGLDMRKKYTKEEINKYVNSWYEEMVQIHKL